MEILFQRRSIRKYLSDPVNMEDINDLIKAAMAAPSAGNQQPWEFIIISDRQKLLEITKIHPHSQMLKTAPMAIVVCADLDRETNKGYWVQDCAVAVQNILLEACSKGLGTCWLGIHPRQDRVEGLKKLLEIPENVVPVAAIALGYPDEKKPPSDRFDSSRIHINKY